MSCNLDGKPSVSVCMISFNHVKFVRRSIESVLAQKTDFNYEILVHDDASTDGTADIVRELSEKHPGRIRAIMQSKNIYSVGGKPFAILFSESKGDLIALCECDDYWCDPLKLQKQYDFLVSNQQFSLCYHDALVVNGNDEKIAESNIPQDAKKDFTNYDLMRGRAAISTQTVMFRNKINPMPDEYFKVVNEDSFIFMLLGEHGGGKYLEIVEPSAYRIHDRRAGASRT